MRRTTITIGLLCWSACLLAAGPALDVPIVPDDWKVLHDRWQAAMDELRIPGVAIVAVRDDQIVLLDALGACDPDGKQRVSTRSPFYMASTTKSFTALGVVLLAQDGKMRLDEPVKTYLPRFTLAEPKLAVTITVRDLLSHSYGLNNEIISIAEAYSGNITDDRFYRLLADVEPKGTFAYSNLHYTLAGRVIKSVSGQSWKDFLEDRVFRPLNMRDSTAYASRLYANPLAAWPIVETKGLVWELSPRIKNDVVMHAAGGIGASVADLGAWLRFQFTGNSADGIALVSPELLREYHTQQVESSRDGDNGPPGLKATGYALGWFSGTFGERPFLWHGGGYLGTSTLVSFFPQDKVGVAVVMNESAPNAGFVEVVASDVYGKLLGGPTLDLLPKLRESCAEWRKRQRENSEFAWEPPTTQNGLSREIERYVGIYENDDWGSLHVSNRDGQMALRLGGLELRCHALGKDCVKVELLGDDMQAQFRSTADGKIDGIVTSTPAGDVVFRKQP